MFQFHIHLPLVTRVNTIEFYFKIINNHIMPLKTELTYCGDDPGAARFGNFINYYSFHSSKERSNNLDPRMFPSAEDNTIVCLDIGCNTGELTDELYSTLLKIYPISKLKILAIDIDPTLIQRAQEMCTNSNITYMAADIMTDKGRKSLQPFLCIQKKHSFDIIFGFSVTMWIHINNGDDGLHSFLSFLKDQSRTIIIEPQPWKCYKNAQRRMKRSGNNFELYETLKIREDVDKVIEKIIENGNFKKVYESPSSSWNRKIQSYQIVKNI